MFTLTPVYFLRTGILSTFFKVRMFRSVTAYAGMFFLAYLFDASLHFSRIGTLSTCKTLRIFRVVTP